MPTEQKTRTIAAIIPLMAVGAFATAQDFVVTRRTIDGGGAMFCSGGEFELSGTIGQPDAGTMASATFDVAGGFWFPLTPGDCNGDGGVNLFDYSDYVACVTGPNRPVGDTPCPCFDRDGDRDVDLADFAGLQGAFNGPS